MISIIPYSDRYKSQVIDLLLEIWEREFGYKNIERPDIYNIPETYQKDPKSNFWLALEDEKVVGTIALQNEGENIGYIRRLAVVKNMRKQGVGKQLLETLMEYAKEHSYKKIYVGIAAENTGARHFYKKNDFRENAIIPQKVIDLGDSFCLTIDIQ